MNTIYLTEKDHKRLLDLVQTQRMTNGARAVESLCRELKRAQIVASEEIPTDVVTMNSFVKLRDIKRNAAMEITIVYPKDANLPHRKISVLAPVATAVLGCRVGDEIEVSAPLGPITYKVEKIIYQPEKAGDLHL